MRNQTKRNKIGKPKNHRFNRKRLKHMKRFLHLATFFLVLASAALPLFAQDISIRPKDNPGASGGVNYGIQARPPAPPGPTAQPQVKPPAPQPAPAPQVYQPPAPPPSNTPPPYSSQNSGNVQIIKIDDTLNPIPTGSGQNTIDILIEPGALTSYDIMSLRDSLGLSDVEIRSNCYFEHDVLLQMEQGGNGNEMLNLGANTKAQYRYNGAISQISFFPTIACRAIKQPVSGVIIQKGQFYKLSISTASCPPPASATSTLTFRYLGDGNGSCVYR